MVVRLLSRGPALAVCSYPLDRCHAEQLLKIMAAHPAAMIKRGGAWQRIDNIEGQDPSHREAEERLHIATEAAALGIYDHDFETGVVKWDARVRALWGVAPGRVITYEELLASVHPEDRRAFEAGIDHALEPNSDGRVAVEYRITNQSDGRLVWIAATGQAFFRHGRSVRLVGTVQDITERKRTELELQQVAEKYATLFDATSDGVWIQNLQGEIVEVNDAFCRMSGYTREELVGSPIGLVEAIETQEEVQAHVDRIRETHHDRFDSKHRRKDGSLFDVDITVLYYEKEGGRMATFIRDITARKRTELELHRVAKKYATLFNATSDGVWMVNLQGEIVEVNDAYCRMSGYPREELLYRPLSLVEATETPEDTAAHISRIVESGHDRFDTRHRRKDGSIFDLDITVLYSEKEGGRIASFGRDITERKQTENALRRSQQDLDRAEEVGQIGSWRLDIRANVLTWSDEIHRIFGIPKGTPLTYETFLASVHPEDRDYVDTRWKAGLQGEPYDIEHRIIVGGTTKWVREKAYLEVSEEGELLGGFGIAEDITEHKRAAEALLAAERSRVELLETLNREISHRTKNNLAIVAGLLQLQSDQAVTPEEQTNLIGEAVTRIMTFAALHEQMYQRHSDRVEMLDALRRITDVHRQASGGRVRFEVGGTPAEYSAPVAANLCVVANELITNAVKHANGPEEDRLINIHAAPEESFWILTVWNSGEPISSDFRVEDMSRTGLRLVRTIIEGQYGGCFDLQPEGAGTLAQVLLPEARLREEPVVPREDSPCDS